jgi:hypothetical protein
MLIDTLQAAGRNEECEAAWKELIELTEQTAVYWEKAQSAARTDFARWSIERR